MSLDKLILILVCALLGFGVALWLIVVLVASYAAPVAAVALIPVALAGYIVWRVVRERLGNEAEDHYDGMEH